MYGFTRDVIFVPGSLDQLDCGGFSSSNADFGPVELINTKEGYSNPDFKAQIAAHMNATTYFRGTKYVQKGGSSTWLTVGVVGCYVAGPPPGIVPKDFYLSEYGWLPGLDPLQLPSSTPTVDSHTYNLALSAFYSRCRAAQEEFQSGQFLGELRETLHLFQHPLKSIRKGINSYLSRLLKYGRKVGIPRRGAYIADAWLEAQFGLAPLFSDVASAARALAALTTARDVYVRVQASGVEEELVNHIYSENVSWNSNLHRFDSEFTSVRKNTVKFYGQMACSVAGDRDFEYKLFGLTWSDFVPTVYNLIPATFIADYFSNAGDVIDAYSQARSDLRWQCQVIRGSSTYKWIYIPHGLSGLVIGDITVLSDEPALRPFSLAHVSVERKPYFDQVLPSLTWKWPGFSTKWINLGALFGRSRAVSRYLRI